MKITNKIIEKKAEKASVAGCKYNRAYDWMFQKGYIRGFKAALKTKKNKT